jgi:hypothetical protein
MELERPLIALNQKTLQMTYVYVPTEEYSAGE